MTFVRRLAWIPLLTVAAALSFWRLEWGLGEGAFFPDERVWALRVLDFVPPSWGSFFPAHLVYPTCYGYLSAAAFVLAEASGLRPSVDAPLRDGILMARLVSALASCATVLATAWIGRRLYGARVGFTAAAFVAVLPMSALQVHYASVDPLLTLLVTAGVGCTWALARRPDPRTAVVCGLVAGVAFATKYTGLTVLAGPTWVLLRHGWRQGVWGAASRLAAGVAVGALAGTALACPPCLIRPDQLRDAVLYHGALTALGTGFAGNHLAESLGWYGRPLLYQLVAALPFALGLPLYLLTAWGLAQALGRRSLADQAVLATVGPYLLVVACSPVTFPRYLLPALPALVLLAAAALVGGDRTGRVAPLLALVWCITAATAATQVARFSYAQQRAVAEWIAARPRPPGDEPVGVGLPAYLDYFRLRAPLRAAGLEPLPAEPGAWLAQRPAYFVVPDWLGIVTRRDRPHGELARELATLESGRAGYHLAAHWPIPGYLGDRLYTALDPAFAVDLYQGSLGFRVYVRDPPGDASPTQSR